MPGFFGSAGFRPDKDMMGDMSQGLMGMASGLSPQQAAAKYQAAKYDPSKGFGAGGDPTKVNWGDLDQGDKQKYMMSQAAEKAQQYKPTFAKGESGYNVQQKGGKYEPYTGYKPQQYSSVKFQEQVSPYYKGMESSAFEGMKAALSQGKEGMGEQMAARGFGGGGMMSQGVGNLSLQAGQGLVDQLRNIRMGKARDLTDIARQQQQMEFGREQAQGQEGQFGTRFGEGQRQFGANFGENQAARKLREALVQQQMDTQYRTERTAAQRQPFEDMMRMYMGQLGASGKDQKGWGAPLIGAGTAAVKAFA